MNRMRLYYLKATSISTITVDIIKHTHKMLMQGEKQKYQKYLGRKIQNVTNAVDDCMQDATISFNDTDESDLIMATTKQFGDIIMMHSFADGNGRICCLILPHVLKQMKCSLFLVILLSCFHRSGRRHYIKEVKIFEQKPSLLYTMIVKSLIHH